MNKFKEGGVKSERNSFIPFCALSEAKGRFDNSEAQKTWKR